IASDSSFRGIIEGSKKRPRAEETAEDMSQRHRRTLTMNNHTPQVISIQVAPGTYATVDVVDADLLQDFRWGVLRRNNNQYVRARTFNTHTKPRQTPHLLHRLIFQRVIGRLLQRAEFVDHFDGNT